MQWIISMVVFFLVAVGVHAEERDGVLGVWVWRDDAVRDEAKGRELVEFCRGQGIDTVLLQIHYVDGSSPLQVEFPEGYRRLLRDAAAAGIRVEALDGDSGMALAEGRADTFRRLDALLAFQAGLPENARFAAVHFDIEPYTLPRWREGVENRRVMAREMLETFAMLKERVRAAFPSLPVKFDIPAWYDMKPELAVDFAGATKLLSEHIQDIADEVVLMSYRRTATGKNSVEELGANELAYAAARGKTLSLALETIALKEDPQISFFGLPPEQFRAAVHEIFRAHKGKPGFGGLYLHQYDRLKTYLEGTEPLFPPRS